ncbi:MAG: alpha/beta hydrolase [Paracoccaceae bacterium]|nr:MAG: alpha/beta hydrolase [Paracoccaceae bacterium]
MMRAEVRNGDVRLATETMGPGDGPGIVLVMGATASMLGWPAALCADLAGRGFRVVRFDHRDTGQSSTRLPPYDAEDMAGDVLAVMDACGMERAHLAGMSLGGFLAQMLAVAHPGRVAGLTLIASEPLGWDGAALPGIDARFLDHFAGFAALDWTDGAAVAAFLLGIERLCAGSATPFDAAAARTRVAAVLDHAADPAAAFTHGGVGTRQDWTGRFRRIACPVTVVHGTEDPILPLPNGRALAAGIAGARLVEWPGRGHELHPGDMAGLAALIADGARPAG